MDYRIILYIFFGVLPSLTWLFYYMSKDMHPEPKRMIMKIFVWGAVITVPVFIVQVGFTKLLDGSGIDSFTSSILHWFLIIAFTEELFKYLVIKFKVIGRPELDEPLDIMLYMVVAALGFAALENVLYLFAPAGSMTIEVLMGRTLAITFVRFIGATFLHTLCSAVIGYALAVSFCEVKRRYLSLAGGIILATLLHGAYDFSIMTLEGYLQLVVPAVIIITLALFVFLGFDYLKKKKSVCKIK